MEIEYLIKKKKKEKKNQRKENQVFWDYEALLEYK